MLSLLLLLLLLKPLRFMFTLLPPAMIFSLYFTHNMIGITSTLSAFLGETCLYMLTIFLTATLLQGNLTSSASSSREGPETHGEF